MINPTKKRKKRDPVIDACDGLAPLAVTFGPLGAALLLAARPRMSTLHLGRHQLLRFQWPF